MPATMSTPLDTEEDKSEPLHPCLASPYRCPRSVVESDSYVVEAISEYVKLTDEGQRIEWKLRITLEKSLSPVEMPGSIYTFRIEGDSPLLAEGTAIYKVGRTLDYKRRMVQWNAQCPSQTHSWYEPVWVEHCHRTGE
ncbi:hypothetical protein E1B28_008213 [Marasmius oreades]|uniref:Bacteriophage T5 Orf172 DNA-binding domain-containing protein n=1 Tax=Marasmius oreades TaxID=181124 RepID=A0A9P7RYJ5_9AGAR|nr:uncharacterized protein E1B28_008213 [Marasmius oreades]KAG7091810.1 hypothetical protein E1B28_008213 [Marasmius oreades]